jgi:hypothetical protein
MLSSFRPSRTRKSAELRDPDPGARDASQIPQMRGFITEQHFDQAEAEFPGIRELYAACEVKPRTFVELLARYLRMMSLSAAVSAQAA